MTMLATQMFFYNTLELSKIPVNSLVAQVTNDLSPLSFYGSYLSLSENDKLSIMQNKLFAYY
jgi:hypothetical protein